MADQAKIGTDWSNDELDRIVADYFAMLALEQAGQPYVKSHRAAAVMADTGRTHRSVEFKHMNISAVLQELSMETIRGYKPKPNYQNAIFDAVDRYLTRHPAVVAGRAPVEAAVHEAGMLSESPPPSPSAIARVPASLVRLVRKFDVAARDQRNRELGKAGEALVVDFERAKLIAAERADLARRVRWVAEEDGDGAGYDVLSFNPRGQERLIEVKTTRAGQTAPFFLSRNERALSQERPDAFRLFRVYEFSTANRVFTLRPPLEDSVLLEPETYRASFS